MAPAKRLGLAGDALSKKTDVPLRTSESRPLRLLWNPFRRRRILFCLLATALVYFFIKNIPTDVPPVGQRYNPTFGSLTPGQIKAQPGLLLGDKPKESQNAPDGLFDGPIRFHNLAASLQPFLTRPNKNNVLFLLADPTSASKVLPLACEMRRHDRNTVHIALLGRQKTTIENIMKINGVTLSDCPVHWHDATPDYGIQSTEARNHLSVKAGLSYLHNALHPQTMLIDDLLDVDRPLAAVVEDTAYALAVPLVVLPTDSREPAGWILSLDCQSLNQLANIQVEILVQAYSQSAGSLIRLLRSLKKANYDGLPIPQLTIELPSQTDPFLMSYLASYRWPPRSTAQESRLTIRRRIDHKQITPALASLRMVESFYPATPSSSHVLVLSPNVELSPNYMQYLFYTLLEYKYGRSSSLLSHKLFGISLITPKQTLDDSEPFVRASILKDSLLLLSQSPSSEAALFFGDRWVEFHQFLSNRLETEHGPGKSRQNGDFTISRRYPEWLSYALELMQTQGLYTIYPAFREDKEHKFAILHEELYQPPEEFVDIDDPSPVPMKGHDLSHITAGDVLVGENIGENTAAASEIASTGMSMSSLFSKDTAPDGRASLPELVAVPLVSSSGTELDWVDSEIVARKFAEDFSLSVGGCASLDARSPKRAGTIDFMFCNTS